MKYMVDEDVNIDECPAKDTQADITEVTIGDLHANAIKFLYFLIRHGIYSVNPEHYSGLVSIYKKIELTTEDLKVFEDLLSQMNILSNTTLVRLIGDELADRGNNDYFILKILEKLHRDHIKVEIILSNHGLEFVEAYERYPERKKFVATVMLKPAYTHSIKKLDELIEKQWVSPDEVLSIVDRCYKPNLKIIGYSLDCYEDSAEGLTLYSHAAIDLSAIKKLAIKFDTHYKDATRSELVSTIDDINHAFKQLVAVNLTHTLYNIDELKNGYRKHLMLTRSTVVEYILWNREYSYLNRPESYNNYRLSFVHGHDSAGRTSRNLYNLDSAVGKKPEDHQENYRALSCDQLPHSQLIASPFALAENLFRWFFLNSYLRTEEEEEEEEEEETSLTV